MNRKEKLLFVNGKKKVVRNALFPFIPWSLIRHIGCDW